MPAFSQRAMKGYFDVMLRVAMRRSTSGTAGRMPTSPSPTT